MLEDCSNGLVCSHLVSIFFGNLLPHKFSVYPSDWLWLVGQWQMWQKKRLKSACTLGLALLLLLKLYNYHKTNKQTNMKTNKKQISWRMRDHRKKGSLCPSWLISWTEIHDEAQLRPVESIPNCSPLDLWVN